MANIQQVQKNKAFGGSITKFTFEARTLGGLQSTFNIFVPQAPGGLKLPILYYLAGLTCNEDTAPWKAGFLRDASEERLALVFPDTSPRGARVQIKDEDWDFGTDAGLYINATSEPWSKHYKMYDFVTKELPEALRALNLPLDFDRESVFGHSMGGHGAISIYLRNAERFKSASAFAPMLNPIRNPWGQKPYNEYLKGGLEEGKLWDSTEILLQMNPQSYPNLKVLIDYGDEDRFYKDGRLMPEAFIDVAKKAGFSESQINVRRQEGYDHGYYFVSTFGPEHIKFHSKYLKI